MIDSEHLKAREVINIIINAYEEKALELNCPKHVIFDGMRKVRDVFLLQPCRRVIHELIALMMQPSNEASFVNNIDDPLAKGKQRIQVNIKVGMGLNISSERQVEIFNFINSKAFRPKAFATAFANVLTSTMRKYKR